MCIGSGSKSTKDYKYSFGKPEEGDWSSSDRRLRFDSTSMRHDRLVLSSAFAFKPS